jgi:hypothetical protein
MMLYSLQRERDGAGDSGHMSLAIYKDDKGTIQMEENARPRVGVSMRVGSHYARSYSAQDWWQTTYIQEIISETPDQVVFKTGNSVYTWTQSE